VSSCPIHTKTDKSEIVCTNSAQEEESASLLICVVRKTERMQLRPFFVMIAWGLIALILQLLLSDVEARLGDDANLLDAARDGDLDKVKSLLQNGKASFMAKNNYGVR
jgi:hypothetical protein